MEYYWIIYLVVALINGLIFGFVTQTINENKGYDGGFAWGFFLGAIGIIVVACKPAVQTQSSPSTGNAQRVIQDEVKREVQRALEEERRRMTTAESNNALAMDIPPQISAGVNNRMENFLDRAAKCTRVSEILSMWELEQPCENQEISGILKQAATIERMYGVSNVPKTLDKIRAKLPACPVISLDVVTPDTLVADVAAIDRKPTVSDTQMCAACKTEQPSYHTFCYHCGKRL